MLAWSFNLFHFNFKFQTIQIQFKHTHALINTCHSKICINLFQRIQQQCLLIFYPIQLVFISGIPLTPSLWLFSTYQTSVEIVLKFFLFFYESVSVCLFFFLKLLCIQLKLQFGRLISIYWCIFNPGSFATVEQPLQTPCRSSKSGHKGEMKTKKLKVKDFKWRDHE